MNVVFAAAEAVPFAKTGGLADVMGALPKALVAEGCNVSIFLPFYKEIEEGGFSFTRVDDHLLSLNDEGVQFYFIDHDHFFDRDGLYGDANGDFDDNFDRFSYFCEMVLENLIEPDVTVDVIHCHDWHAALIPVLLKAKYKEEDCFKNTKTVLTIHNLAFQGIFPKERFSQLNLEDSFLTDKGLLFYDQLSFLKGGILFSDQVTTVSEKYANEIQTKEFGCGLDEEIKGLKRKVKGIVNGLDHQIWSPERDPLIFENYDSDVANEIKPNNKEHLQQQFNLETTLDKIVFGFVGRISHQKGVDYIVEAIPELVNLPFQFIIQGMGDPKMQDELKEIAEQYSNVAYFDGYDETRAHKIYAGSDFFLMPSIFEPCGLSQMIAMRYGTLPLVAPTGGLVDTVKCGVDGLQMKESSTLALIESIKEAQKIFENKDQLDAMRRQAMQTHFEWSDSAKKYKDMYECI